MTERAPTVCLSMEWRVIFDMEEEEREVEDEGESLGDPAFLAR